MKIILASQSQRRAAILELAKIDFEVIPSSYEEKILEIPTIEDKYLRSTICEYFNVREFKYRRTIKRASIW